MTRAQFRTFDIPNNTFAIIPSRYKAPLRQSDHMLNTPVMERILFNVTVKSNSAFARIRTPYLNLGKPFITDSD